MDEAHPTRGLQESPLQIVLLHGLTGSKRLFAALEERLRYGPLKAVVLRGARVMRAFRFAKPPYIPDEVFRDYTQHTWKSLARTFDRVLLGMPGGPLVRDIADARHANAANERSAAILKLPRSIVVQRRELGAAGLEQARAAGLTDREIVETVANVALNIFSNYINHVAGTIVDFPEVKPGNPYVTPSCDCA